MLQQFLDEVIDTDTAARVEQHLETCPRCGPEASAYREIKQSLRRRGDADTAALDRLKAFVARIGEEHTPRPQ